MESPKFLNRYNAVKNDKLPACLKVTKHISVEFDQNRSLEELWNIHDIEMENYRQVFKEINSGVRSQDLPQARSSLLDLKIAIADKILQHCHFCERRCGANRKEGEVGYCRLDKTSRYASEFLHMGEEPELVPSHTIFLTGCVFSCVYCQNWNISTRPESGVVIDPQKVGRLIDMRRRMGARNVNFVTPTPHLHKILDIVNETKVNTPVIWNSNMYHSWEAGKLLEGVIDVYLADFKYGNNECAKWYSNAKDYMRVVERNFETAYQSAEIILRHLVIPGHVECCTRHIAEWTATHIPKLRFNLMFQYMPHYRAAEFPEINMYLSQEDCEHATRIVLEAGLGEALV